MSKRVPAVSYMVFLYVRCYCISQLIEKGWRPSPTLTVPRPPSPCNPCLHSRLTEFAVVNLNLTWKIWICRGEFKFPWWIWISVVNLNLPSECEFAMVSLLQWTWICRGEFELALVKLNLPQRIWICRCKFEFAVVNLNFDVANLNLPWWIWNCQSEFEFAMVNLNLLWRISILPWWISNCRGEFEFAVVNLNSPWWIWICRGQFEFAVGNLNFL